MGLLGRMFAGPLMVAYIGIGLWGFFLVEQYLYHIGGWLLVIGGLFFFPFIYTLAPLYAGIADGYWLPALVCYSPIALMLVMSFATSAFSRG